MASLAFDQKKWVAYVLGALQEESVFLKLVNTQILNEVKFGSSFVVTADPKLTASTYEGSIDPTVASITGYAFNVDQKKHIAIRLPDESAQQSEESEESLKARFINAIQQGLRRAADNYLAGQYANFATLGTNSAPKTASDNASTIALLQEILTKCDQIELPEDGRFLVVGHQMAARILAAYPTNSAQSKDEVISKGFVNHLFGFDIYKSGSIKTDSAATEVLIAGYKDSLGFGHNVTTLETLRAGGAYATDIRGLYVFGGGSLGHPTSDPRGVKVFTKFTA